MGEGTLSATPHFSRLEWPTERPGACSSGQATAGWPSPRVRAGPLALWTPQRMSRAFFRSTLGVEAVGCGGGRGEATEAKSWLWGLTGQQGGAGSRCQSGEEAARGCPVPPPHKHGCLYLGGRQGSSWTYTPLSRPLPRRFLCSLRAFSLSGDPAHLPHQCVCLRMRPHTHTGISILFNSTAFSGWMERDSLNLSVSRRQEEKRWGQILKMEKS